MQEYSKVRDLRKPVMKQHLKIGIKNKTLNALWSEEQVSVLSATLLDTPQTVIHFTSAE